MPSLKVNKAFWFSFGIAVLVWSLWYFYTRPDGFSIVSAHWPIMLTMVFGSFIAGATSEGGGAVAFPVFTKFLHISSFDAKMFALAIQSVGMTAASLTIVVMRVPVAWRMILWASLGGLIGLTGSSVLLAPRLPPALVKMLFTTMIVSFALPLWVLCGQHRQYNHYLPVFGWREKAVIFATGTAGGGMTALVGSGIDIICFSVMVLWFRLTEKISTPSSVILMAINALAGFLLHLTVLGGFTVRVEQYWLAAVPVVVVGAPLGAYCCTRLNNKTIALILIILIMMELISSLWLIPLTTEQACVALLVFALFFFMYYRMSKSVRYQPIDEENRP